jgi:hypothetical protein
MITTSLGLQSWEGVPSCQHGYTPKIYDGKLQLTFGHLVHHFFQSIFASFLSAFLRLN